MNKVIENLKYNKKSLLILSVLVLVTIFTLILKTTVADPSTGYLGDQIVDGLSFEDAGLSYNNGITTFTAKVYNKSGDTYNLKTINIKFKDSKDKETTLIGYIGDSLEKNDSKYLNASIDQDLSDSISIVYVINK